MSAIDKVRRALMEAATPCGPPLWPTPEIIEAASEDDVARLAGFSSAAEFAEHEAQHEADRCRRERRARLFGHPLARVFIVGNRLVVLRPRGIIEGLLGGEA